MSAIDIEFLSAEVESVKNYKQMTVNHKLLSGPQAGKLEGKKIFSFVTPEPVWTTLLTAKPGDTFTVDREKDKKTGQYWEWVGIHRQDGVASAPTAASGPSGGINKYEEKEARRQRMIVRQSSIGHALKYYEMNQAIIELKDVFETAKEIEKFVFEVEGE